MLFLSKVDKVYLSAPPKIVIIDHEKKRTFVLRKEGLPDVGELGVIRTFFYSSITMLICEILGFKLLWMLAFSFCSCLEPLGQEGQSNARFRG